MKACCLAGSSLRDIASGLRCSSPRRCTSAISPERLSETTPNSCSIHAPGRPRQGVADPCLQRHLLLQGQLAGATPVLEAGQTIDPVRLEKPVPRPDRIVVDQQHPTNILAAHPAIQQHQRVRPTGQTMLSQPVPSQLGQVLPFLRCQKAAANHGAEKNPSVPVWQAVFSTSHRVAVYLLKCREKMNRKYRFYLKYSNHMENFSCRTVKKVNELTHSASCFFNIYQFRIWQMSLFDE